MKSLAIITARGGSKRIPRKNIKEFCGRPIIIYSIEAALKSGAFDEVMVSTDDKEIARIAADAGASVPFFRSEDTSNDHAGTDAVIAEVLSCYRERGITFDRFCCIYPTAPFITPARLKEAMDMPSARYVSSHIRRSAASSLKTMYLCARIPNMPLRVRRILRSCIMTQGSSMHAERTLFSVKTARTPTI